MVLVYPLNLVQQTSDGNESMYGGKNIILSFQGCYVQYNTPIFCSTSRTLCYHYFAAMLEHGSTTSKTLLCSKLVITDNESLSSERVSEGYANKHNGYNTDKELLVYDQDGGESYKQSQNCMHTHMCQHSHEHSHAHLHPHDENLVILTVEYPQANFLRWHYRLGHLYFNLIKAMSEVGLLTNNLVKLPVPKCEGCIFATMTKKPWHTKGKNIGGQVGRIT